MNRIGLVVALLLLAVAVLMPGFVSSYRLLTVTQFLLLAMLAQGWNFIGGYTGYAAFGNVAFFGIGAYTTGLLMIGRWHWPFLLALPAGAAAAALAAVLVGLAVLGLKGHYFAIATLGVAEAGAQVAATWDSVTGGSDGIDLPLAHADTLVYFLALAGVLAGLLLTWRFAHSRLGYGCIAIREDEDSARAVGVDTTACKVTAYALSAMLAGLAGGLRAYQNVHVAPEDFFSLDYTLQMIIATIIGGAGSITGPVVGAAVFQALSTYVWGRFLELHPSVLGITIILFVVFLPRGLMTFVSRQRGLAFRLGDLLQNVREHRVV